MNIYRFEQTPIDGTFDKDDKICNKVWIEADSKNEAIEIATGLGVDFEDVYEDQGARWETSILDYERFCVNGWDVAILNTDESKIPTDEWLNKYGKYEILEYPKQEGYFYKGVIRFKNIEEYAQYLADNYGFTTPDIRIFYKNGTVKEISSSL